MNIQDLENKIVKASEAYYLESPIMTDKEFDNLLDQLRDQDPNNKILTSVGWGLRVYGNKVKIPKEIKSSLPKIKDVKDIGAEELHVSLKVDGMSAILEYENGVLKYALTRGDGVYGIDFTEKAKYIQGISKINPSLSLTHIVRGELFIGIKTFNENLAEDYANPRNAVAGIVNAKGFSNLEYVSFIEHPFQSQVVNEQLFLDKVKADINWEEYFKEFKNKYDYPVDGLCVIDVKKFKEYEGNDDIINHVYALKLATEEVETEVVEIEWNLSNRGKFIPIIKYKPVNLYGTICKQTSGYHYQYVKENNIGVGTIIKLTKANEIIPYITEIVKSTKFEEPIIEEYPVQIQGVNLVVSDFRFMDKLLVNNFLAHHFNFDGYKKASNLMFKLGVLSISSFKAETSENRSDESLDESLAEAKVNSTARPILIKKLRGKLNIDKFFSHFGINGVGSTASFALQPLISDYVRIALSEIPESSATEELMKLLETVKVNKNVRESLSDPRVAIGIARCYKTYEDRWYSEDETKPKVELTGNEILAVITGSLSMTKKEMGVKLLPFGIKVIEKLDKNVNILITNDKSSGSSKMKFAEKNNIETLTEQELYQKFNIN